MKPLKYKLKDALEKNAYINYYTAKVYQTLWFYSKYLREKDPILIYQMGKVGSSTLQKSLNTLKLNRSVYHIHTLTKENLDYLEKVLKNSFHLTRSVPGHYVRGRYLLKELNKKNNTNRKWTIITLVRDPIARNISSFFQDINHRYPSFNYPQKEKSMESEKLIRELIKLYFARHDHEKPLWWFDKELKQTFGIDVFSSPFPKSQGYKIYNGERANVLLIRTESLNKCADKALKEFLNIKNVNLININLANQKGYYSIYSKFIDSIIFPPSYIKKMYNSKFMKHFYTEQEIHDFKLKWIKKSIVSFDYKKSSDSRIKISNKFSYF